MTTPNSRLVDRALTRLKLRQLQLLIEIERHGSILHAARALNLSQPAATKLIKDLETDFDVPLFTRTNRGAVPTAFGHSLIRHGKLVFAQITHAAQELEDLSQGRSGRVVVGTLLAASAQLLPLTVAAMLKERPDLTIKILDGTHDVLMPGLRSGEIDLVLGRLPSRRHREDITQMELFRDHIVAVVGPRHPLLAKTPPLQDIHLSAYPWILPPSDTTLGRQFEWFLADHPEYRPRQSVESISFLANRALLLHSDMIAFLPSQVVKSDLENGVLVQLHWRVPFGTGPIGISYRAQSALSPAAEAFIQTARHIGAKLASPGA